MKWYKFDQQDHHFLSLVNRIIEQSHSSGDERSLFYANLHPNGILDLAMPREMRMASAVLHLLDTLHLSKEAERIQALQNLYDEVLVSAKTTFRHNTGRVLIQIMKELVRGTTSGDKEKQLRLAHDFRLAATGKPTVVRRMLRRYYLLEMPEEWNQAVFDHHVHDANTKGRKNATHLIMDAWIKGIRSLTVIYYNYVTPEAARELLSAAEIMGITLRIGILFHAPHRGRLVDFIWVPRGFSNANDFLAFLDTPNVKRLMDDGRKASLWLEEHILKLLEQWNEKTRHEWEEQTGFCPEPLDKCAFRDFVATGQTSLLHLAEYIHKCIYPSLSQRATFLSERLNQLPLNDQAYGENYEQLCFLNNITPEYILKQLEHLLASTVNISCLPTDNQAGCPELLRLPPLLLLDWVNSLHSGNRVILNLACLTPEDVLTLLWDCQGLITHLELFNLKDWQEGKAPHTQTINDLQQAINGGSGPLLKQIIRSMIRDCESETDDPDRVQRLQKLRMILRNIPTFHDFYKKSKLYTRFGTDSTSRPGRHFGMGLFLPQTLPRRAQKELAESTTPRLRLPMHIDLVERISYQHITGTYRSKLKRSLLGLVQKLPGHLGMCKKREWLMQLQNIRICNGGDCTTDTRSNGQEYGNIFTLGGMGMVTSNGFHPERYEPELRQRQNGKKGETPQAVPVHQYSNSGDKFPADLLREEERHSPEGRGSLLSAWRNLGYYMNTNLANALKVIIGFIPAFLTFQYTQEWWVLAWFGAPLWFGITGLRNIIQAVMGGGGFRRSPLLRWNSYVSWSRLCDSLMFTGFSVVLLEYVMRVLVLQNQFDITSANHQILAFTIISIVNGFYIAAHNYFRGLQVEAIVGNLFRSVFAIPVSLAYNSVLVGVLLLLDVPDPFLVLLPSAAIISKLASDTVAGVIEGIADGNSNDRLREWDYNTKLKQVFESYSQLDLCFPEQGVLEMLTKPREILLALANGSESEKNLRLALIVNALDLMYFWYYQPRAPQVLGLMVPRLSRLERQALMRTQRVLRAEKEVVQLFVDGLVGRNFSRALSFYLDRHEAYLHNMAKVCLAKEERRKMKKTQ